VIGRRSLGDDAEKNVFLFIEITISDAAGGSKCLDRA
jgi:hypothetical protein